MGARLDRIDRHGESFCADDVRGGRFVRQMAAAQRRLLILAIS